jgi:hypothetical protein
MATTRLRASAAGIRKNQGAFAAIRPPFLPQLCCSAVIAISDNLEGKPLGPDGAKPMTLHLPRADGPLRCMAQVPAMRLLS